VLRIKFSEHANLVRYVQQCKTELLEAAPSPSSVPQFHTGSSSSASRGQSGKIFSGLCKNGRFSFV